jgi:hypothetical protein
MPAVDESTVSPSAQPGLDGLTIGAIAIVAWALADMLHEGLGHGGTALLVGARPTALTSSYFSYDEASVSRFASRLISAGGSVVNVIVALPLLAIIGRLRGNARFFVWLLATLNLLTAFGYLCYSGVGGIGDWKAVIDGVPHETAWRVVEILVGGVCYFVLAPWLLWPGLRPFVGGGADRERRARRLTLVPYLVGGTTSVLSGMLNPLGLKIMLISSVAAAFGGASLLAWFFPQQAAREKSGEAPAMGVARSVGWMVAAGIAFALFVGVLGRGVRLG